MPLLLNVCPCGWKLPRSLSVEGSFSAATSIHNGSAKLSYLCPECGTRFAHRNPTLERVGEEAARESSEHVH